MPQVAEQPEKALSITEQVAKYQSENKIYVEKCKNGRFYGVRIEVEGELVKDNKTLVPSMTTIDSVISKGVAYDNWLMNSKDPIKWRDYKADIGTKVHELIDHLVLDKEISINVDEYTERSENEIKKRILGYIEWYKGHNPICYASELSLYSEDLPFSGTADFIGYIRKTEELVIIDYKTGNEYKSHQIQLNGYRMLWNALFPSHPIDAIYGLYLKDGWRKKPTFTFKKYKIDEELVWSTYNLWKWFNANVKGVTEPKFARQFPNTYKLIEGEEVVANEGE